LVQWQNLELKGSKRLLIDLFKTYGAKVNFKKILSNEVQALINLINIQEELTDRHSDITKRLELEDLNLLVLTFAIVLVITTATKAIFIQF